MVTRLMRRLAALWRHALLWLQLVWPAVALAAIVTASQVADAVRRSDSASAWLRSNADQIGALAMFESRGNTAVFNGSCCYGVLQMNTTNIRAMGMTTREFQAAPLQVQVNAWSAIMSNALNHTSVRTLVAMGNFAGQPVDTALVLACVQIGQGHCGTMIRSGSCMGFADRNGTTICDMANRIRTNIGAATTPVTNPTGVTAPPAPAPYAAAPTIVTDPEDAFFSAAAVDFEDLSTLIKMAAGAILLLMAAYATSAMWGQFSTGKVAASDLIDDGRRLMLVVMFGSIILVGW